LAIKDGKFNNDVALPSQNYIADFDLWTGLPITTSGSPSSKYRNDYFWINISGLRVMLRTGGWAGGSVAGYFAATLDPAPTGSGLDGVAGRAGKY
jgi:hypothetical protein